MTFKTLKVSKIRIFTNTILNKKLVVHMVGNHSVKIPVQIMTTVMYSYDWHTFRKHFIVVIWYDIMT